MRKPVGNMMCPGCSDPVIRLNIPREGCFLSVETKRLRYAHTDSSALCPEMTARGYQPALPVKLSGGCEDYHDGCRCSRCEDARRTEAERRDEMDMYRD